MRNFILIFAAASLAVAGDASYVGWISDASCGAGNAGAKAESRECAERCIKGGAPAVLVTDADQKVYKLAAGKTNFVDHIKHRVKITGELKGDTLTVKEIQKAD